MSFLAEEENRKSKRGKNLHTLSKLSELKEDEDRMRRNSLTESSRVNLDFAENGSTTFSESDLDQQRKEANSKEKKEWRKKKREERKRESRQEFWREERLSRNTGLESENSGDKVERLEELENSVSNNLDKKESPKKKLDEKESPKKKPDKKQLICPWCGI